MNYCCSHMSEILDTRYNSMKKKLIYFKKKRVVLMLLFYLLSLLGHLKINTTQKTQHIVTGSRLNCSNICTLPSVSNAFQ